MNVAADGPTSSRPYAWWHAAKGRLHEALGPVARRVRNQHAARRDAYLHFIRMYAGADITSLSMSGYSRDTHHGVSRPKPLAFNMVSSVCNTAQAKVAKNRPIPQFLTQGGNWSQQRRARDLSRYVEGAFDRCGVWEMLPLVVLDALVPGDGVVKIYRDDATTYVEREFPWRVLEDEVEAQYGQRGVRTRYHVKPYDRGVLAAMYPDHEQAIWEARNEDDEREWGVDSTADQILVTEAWHLRSGKKAKDGVHAVCIPGVTLLQEPYEFDYHPFAWLQRNTPLIGCRAQGMAEEVDGIQQEINFTARVVQQSFRKNGGSHWAVPHGTQVHIEQLNNGIATLLRFKGVKPELVQQTPVHPAMIDYLFALLPRGFEQAGVSQLSAQSVKPAGLNSGAAQREYNDIETERFVVFARALEDFCKEIARQLIPLERQLAEKNPEHSVKSPAKRFMRRIKFVDVDLDEDAYVMQCFPTSMLSKTPAGRLAMVGDLAKAGWITPQQAKRLLDMPDLDRLNDLENASHELVEELIERMLDDGEYETPEPFMDLLDAAHTTQMAYLRAKIDKAPEENRALLRDFIDECIVMLNKQTAAAAPPAPPGMPPGMPPPAPLEATGMYGPGAAPPPAMPVAA